MLDLNGLPPELAPDPGDIRTLLSDRGEALFAKLAEHRDARIPYSFEYSVRHPDGSEHTLKMNVFNEFDGQGSRMALFAVAMDVTEQVRREQALKRARAAGDRAGGRGAEAGQDRSADRPRQPPRDARLARKHDGLIARDRRAAGGADLRHRPLQARSTTPTATDVGDEVLRRRRRDRPQRQIRADDLVGRIGGEEFVCILSGVERRARRAPWRNGCAARSREATEQATGPRATISIGLAMLRAGRHRRNADAPGRRRALRGQGRRPQPGAPRGLGQASETNQGPKSLIRPGNGPSWPWTAGETAVPEAHVQAPAPGAPRSRRALPGDAPAERGAVRAAERSGRDPPVDARRLARPSGIWRTPRGSSRPSCCATMCRATACSTSAGRSCSIPITRREGDAHRARPARHALAADASTKSLAWRAHVDAAMAPLLADPRQRGAGRARHRARAAAPGTAADRHQARAVPEPARPGDVGPAQRSRAAAMPARSRWHRASAAAWREIGHDGRRLRVRQRRAAPSRACSSRYALADRLVTNGEWRRSSPTAAIADPRCGCPTAGPGCSAEGSRRRSTGASGERLQLHARLAAASIRAAPVDAHVSYLRGRRVRDLGGRAAADRGRMGSVGRGRTIPGGGNQLDAQPVAPLPSRRIGACSATVWQWTRSAPICLIPRFAPAAGAVGEYNGKFMSGQFVLRGAQLRHAARALARELPQLLLPAPALAVHRPAAGQGRLRWRPAKAGAGRARRGRRRPRRSAPTCSPGWRSRRRRCRRAGSTTRRGSALFEAITRLPEYYPTRAETAILPSAAASSRR